jgi:hypothetical protein
MSHYDEVLEEARSKASVTAKEYIPKLFDILVNEENKTAEDARGIIEHDLIEYWAKSTVRKFLPHEAKDEIKTEAGKKGAEKKKIMLLADGTRAASILAENKEEEINENVPVKDSEDFYEEYKKDTFQPIPETQTLTKKTSDVQSLIDNKILNEENIFEWLNKREDKIKCFYFGSCGTGFIKANILKNLENSGIKSFKRLYFEV